MDRHLWECRHPYYCEEENYYSKDAMRSFKSFKGFFDEEGDADMDYNLLFRWDWLEEDPETGESNYSGDDYYRNGRLLLFFMGQRKGLYRSVSVEVCRADEPKVIEYLRLRWEHMQLLWAPFRPQEVKQCS